MSNKDLIEIAANVGVDDNLQLTRADWLRVAIDLFVEEGVDALRVTRLAEMLGVTRGSFYWHFKNREDLLNALIIFWQQKNAASLLDVLVEINSLNEGVVALFACWLDPIRFDPKLDMMVRNWARTSEKVKEVVTTADIKCIDEIANFFHRMGMKKIEAMTRSRTMYFCQIGYYTLDLKESMSQRLQYLDDTLYMLIGRPIDTTEIRKLSKKYGLGT